MPEMLCKAQAGMHKNICCCVICVTLCYIYVHGDYTSFHYPTYINDADLC